MTQGQSELDAMGQIVRRWWYDLVPDERAKSSGDRAAAAQLRRAYSPIEAATVPATFDLLKRLVQAPSAIVRQDPSELPRVAVCAAVVANVRDDDARVPVARSLGKPTPQDRAPFSVIRLRRLTQADTPEDMLIQFRSLVDIARRTVNVADLAIALLNWTDPRFADSIRRQWIFSYYDVPPIDDEPNVSLSSDEGDVP